MTRSLRRAGSAGVAVVALGLGLAACGGGGSSSGSGDDSSGAASSSAGPGVTKTSDDGLPDARSGTFGPGCSAIPASGTGSFTGMFADPVATAAASNPLLTTLTSAITAAGLTGTLDSAAGLTVFAPTDDAFAKIPRSTLNSLLADKDALTALLDHHLIGENLDPSAVAGQHETLNNDSVTVTGDVNAMKVDGTANVICGNITTSNATVYVIDSVLMPTAG